MTSVASAGSLPAQGTGAEARRPSIAVVDDESGFAG